MDIGAENFQGPQIKKSTFRQSGWKAVATGIIYEYYGTEVPPQDGSFVKIWDNNVMIVSTITPVENAD